MWQKKNFRHRSVCEFLISQFHYFRQKKLYSLPLTLVVHDQDNFLLVFILHVRWETHVQKIWSQSNHKHIISLFNSFVVDFFWCVMQIFLLPTRIIGNLLPKKFFLVPVCCAFCFIFHQQIETHGTEFELTKLFNYSMVVCKHSSRKW